MSLDDLYGEKSYIRGRITACELKIDELEKINKRLEKEILELEADVEILKQKKAKIEAAILFLGLSLHPMAEAKKSVENYYSDSSHTSDWKSKIDKVGESTHNYIKIFKKIKEDALNVKKKLEDEIRKKQESIKENKKTIERTQFEKEEFEEDLRRVQDDIDNYDDE